MEDADSDEEDEDDSDEEDEEETPVKKVPTHCYDQVSLSFVIVILIIFMIGS
jgi:hypothetical protein